MASKQRCGELKACMTCQVYEQARLGSHMQVHIHNVHAHWPHPTHMLSSIGCCPYPPLAVPTWLNVRRCATTDSTPRHVMFMTTLDGIELMVQSVPCNRPTMSALASCSNVSTTCKDKKHTGFRFIEYVNA